MTGVSLVDKLRKGKRRAESPVKGQCSKIFILSRFCRSLHSKTATATSFLLLPKYNFSSFDSKKFKDLKMAGVELVSDAELSDDVYGGFSSEEASDFENYSHQKKNKTVITKKVSL